MAGQVVTLGSEDALLQEDYKSPKSKRRKKGKKAKKRMASAVNRTSTITKAMARGVKL